MFPFSSILNNVPVETMFIFPVLLVWSSNLIVVNARNNIHKIKDNHQGVQFWYCVIAGRRRFECCVAKTWNFSGITVCEV